MEKEVWIAIITAAATILAAVIGGLFLLVKNRKGKPEAETFQRSGRDIVQGNAKVTNAGRDVINIGKHAQPVITNIDNQVIVNTSQVLQKADISPEKKLEIGQFFSALDLGYYGLHFGFYIDLIFDSGVYSIDEMREQVSSMVAVFRNCIGGLGSQFSADRLMGLIASFEENSRITLDTIAGRGEDKPDDWIMVKRIVTDINNEMAGVHYLISNSDIQRALQLGNLLGNWGENDYRGYGLKEPLKTAIREHSTYFLPDTQFPAKLEQIFLDYEEKEDYKDRPSIMKEAIKDIVLKAL